MDSALAALNAAVKALVPTTGKNPETGDRAPVELLFVTMTLSLLAMAALVLNRKKFLN